MDEIIAGDEDCLFLNLYRRRHNCKYFQIARPDAGEPDLPAPQVHTRQEGKNKAPDFIFGEKPFAGSASAGKRRG